jgi:type VII secretion-associated serine protease mycosin
VRAGAVAVVVAAALLVAASPARADTVRDAEWQLAAVQAPDAWAVTKGEGVTVAVLDTGVDTNHPDLTGQVTAGLDAIGAGGKQGDAFWGVHGTWMASLIAAHGHGPNRASGLMGVAPGAHILAVRVIWERDDPIRQLTPSQRSAAGVRPGNTLAAAIRYAVDNGARVINMSLYEDPEQQSYLAEDDEAIQYAVAHDVVVVASEGNTAETTNRTQYPAAFPGVIAVAAVDRDHKHASFSTHSWSTSVAAPGVKIVGAASNNRYVEGDGTSPASAIVAGVCALVRARYPKLSPAQVRQVLERSAGGQPGGRYSEELGWGQVQAAAALKLAGSLAGRPATPQTATYRSRFFGDGSLTTTGLAAAAVPTVAGLALLPLGGAALAGAVALAVVRRRRRVI